MSDVSERKLVQAVVLGHLKEQVVRQAIAAGSGPGTYQIEAPDLAHLTTWTQFAEWTRRALGRDLTPADLREIQDHQTFTGHAAPGTGHDFGRADKTNRGTETHKEPREINQGMSDVTTVRTPENVRKVRQ